MAGTMGCYHHPSQQAVATCRECGKGICRDCYDSYGAGMGAGKALCFDCTEELVKENMAEIAWLRSTVKKERTLMIVGAVIGLIVGIGAMGPAGFVLIFVGASLGTIIRQFNEYGAIIGVPAIIISPIMSIYRFVKRINQMKQCDAILASDARVIQEMRDYFAYTQVMEKSGGGISLDSLVNQGGELYNNSYAQSVKHKGEQAAQSELRQGAVSIAANGEIIRTFDKRIERRHQAA